MKWRAPYPKRCPIFDSSTARGGLRYRAAVSSTDSTSSSLSSSSTSSSTGASAAGSPAYAAGGQVAPAADFWTAAHGRDTDYEVLRRVLDKAAQVGSRAIVLFDSTRRCWTTSLDRPASCVSLGCCTTYPR